MKQPTLITTLLAATVLAPAAAAGPAGQLLDVRGRVEIRHGRQPARAGGLLSELQPGDVIAVKSGRAEVVLFGAGARFALLAGSTARVQPAGLQPLTGPRPQALPPVRQPFAQPLSVTPRPIPQKLLGVLTRGAPAPLLGPRDLSPDGAVAQPPVTLRWEGPIEAEQLLLRVSNGDRIIYQATLPPTARSWELPAAAVPPGGWYAWFLIATSRSGDTHKAYALLRVLTAAERLALARASSLTESPGAAASDDPLPLMRWAELEERVGLFHEARAHYQAVQHLRPQDAAVAAALARLQKIAPP